MSKNQSPTHEVPKLPPLNKQAQCIVVKEKLPPQIACMTDCNELRKNLLQLLKDKKQMERQLHLGKEQIQKSAKQLVIETDRPNEQINARKQHSQFGLEKQIQDVQAKLESTQPVDVAALQLEIQNRYDQQQEFIEFAANAELLDQIIKFQLDFKQKVQTRGALDKQQKMKQPLFQTMLNQVNLDLQEAKNTLDQLFQQRINKYSEVGQQSRDLSSVYIQKLVDIEQRMGIEFQQPKAKKQSSIHEVLKVEKEEAKVADLELSLKTSNKIENQHQQNEIEAKNQEEVQLEIDFENGEKFGFQNVEEKEEEKQNEVQESGDFDQTAEIGWGVDK